VQGWAILDTRMALPPGGRHEGGVGPGAGSPRGRNSGSAITTRRSNVTLTPPPMETADRALTHRPAEASHTFPTREVGRQAIQALPHPGASGIVEDLLPDLAAAGFAREAKSTAPARRCDGREAS